MLNNSKNKICIAFLPFRLMQDQYWLYGQHCLWNGAASLFDGKVQTSSRGFILETSSSQALYLKAVIEQDRIVQFSCSFCLPSLFLMTQMNVYRWSFVCSVYFFPPKLYFLNSKLNIQLFYYFILTCCVCHLALFHRTSQFNIQLITTFNINLLFSHWKHEAQHSRARRVDHL